MKLFYKDIDISGISIETQSLLETVSNFQTSLSNVETGVQARYLECLPCDNWRELRVRQMMIKVTDTQHRNLLTHIDNVAVAINTYLNTIDWGQKIVIDYFDNTIVDILVHSVFDNHRLTKDVYIRDILIQWENRVLSPVIQHLAHINRLNILNNKPLIGDSKCMETWCIYEDSNNERGMFHTIGSMLAKGFFKALVIPCETNFLPSSFVGNLVGWGLHASLPEDRDEIYVLLSIIHSLPHYIPSCGVINSILSYEPGVVKRPNIDIISDYSICHFSDLRDIDIPDDIQWQETLLLLAKRIVGERCVP